MPAKLGAIGAYVGIVALILSLAPLIGGLNRGSRSDRGDKLRLAQIAVDTISSQYVDWPRPTLETNAPNPKASWPGGCNIYNYLDCECSHGWKGADELLESPDDQRVDAVVNFTFENHSAQAELLTYVTVEIVESGFKMGDQNEVPIGSPVPVAARYILRLKDFGFLEDNPRPGRFNLVPPVRIPATGAARIQLQFVTDEDLATLYVLRLRFHFASGHIVDSGKLCGAVAT